MPKHYLVVDLEGTCCDDGSLPNEERETIEIGGVLVMCPGVIVHDFETCVRPVRHPKLTPFCTELTGIAQFMVDEAPLFPAALSNMECWLKPYRQDIGCFVSWGKYDWQQLKRDCAYHGIPYPFNFGCRNLAGVSKPFVGRMNKRRIMQRFGIVQQGRRHRGLDDARNYARIVCAMLKAGWLPS